MPGVVDIGERSGGILSLFTRLAAPSCYSQMRKIASIGMEPSPRRRVRHATQSRPRAALLGQATALLGFVLAAGGRRRTPHPPARRTPACQHAGDARDGCSAV